MLDYIVDSFPFFKKIFRIASNTYWFVYCLFYDFWNFSFSALDKKRSKIRSENYKNSYNYSFYKFRLNLLDKLIPTNFKDADIIWLKRFSKRYELNNSNIFLYRSYFRVLNTKQGFYFNFNLLLKKKIFFLC